MLVLSRNQTGEAIDIGDDIRVYILPNPNKRSTQVRVGIEAPKNINIKRSELPKQKDKS